MSAGQLRSRGPASSPVTPARGAQRLADLVDTVVRRPAAGPAARPREEISEGARGRNQAPHGEITPSSGSRRRPLDRAPRRRRTHAPDPHRARHPRHPNPEMHTLYVTAHAITVR